MKNDRRAMLLFMCADSFCDLRERLNSSYFIVRPTHRDENGFGFQCSVDRIRRHNSLLIRLHMSYGAAQALDFRKTLEDRSVFDRAYDPVSPLQRSLYLLQFSCKTDDGKIIRLGQTRREDQLARFDAENCGDALTRVGKCRFRGNGLLVYGTGIADQPFGFLHSQSRL